MRACRASEASFASALQTYAAGGNIGQVVASLDTMGATGAPLGNINARGKKKDFSLDRINNTWRAMTAAEQDEFRRLNGLGRAQSF